MTGTILLASALFLQAAATPKPSPAPTAPAVAPLLGSGAVPTAVSSPSSATAGPKTLSNLARERKLSKNGGAGTMSATSSRGGADLPAALPTPKPGSADDLESVWRARVDGLRAALDRARDELSRMEAQIPIVYLRNGTISPSAWAARQAALAPYRLKVEDLTAELDRLPEECRKTAGCAPGWLR